MVDETDHSNGQLDPLTVTGTIQTIAIKSSVTATANVIRAPFSEPGIADRLLSDPEFYRNLLSFADSELRKLADGITVQGQENTSAVIKGRLIDLADGFDHAATALTTSNGILTAAAAQTAATILSKARDAYVTICAEHPELFKLAAIISAGYVLHQIGGASADVSALIAYAVVQKEKLSDIIAAWKKEKD
jgi:hypothetical protein